MPRSTVCAQDPGHTGANGLFVLNRGGRPGRGAYWDGQGKYLVSSILLPLVQDPVRAYAFKSLLSHKRFVVFPFLRLKRYSRANSNNSLGLLL